MVDRISSTVEFSPGFSLCSPKQIDKLRAVSWQQVSKNNDVVLAMGSPEPAVLLLTEGVLSVWNMGKEADKVVTDFLSAPQPFLAGLLSQDSSPYEVRSNGVSRSIRIPLLAFRTVMQECPSFSLWVVRCMIRAQAQARFYRARLASLALETRIAFFYWSLSLPWSDADNSLEPNPWSEQGRIVRTKFSQHTLCSYFGVAREEISRKSQLLERAGYLLKRGPLMLLSPDLPFLFSLQAPSPYENPWTQDVAELDF